MTANRERVGFAADYGVAAFQFIQVRANVERNAPRRHAEMNVGKGGWVIEIVDGSGEYAPPCSHCGSVGLDGDDHACSCPTSIGCDHPEYVL